MIAIIQALDNWTIGQTSALTRKLFGFCELVKKTTDGKEQVFPAQIIEGTSERKQVSLNDQYQVITWVRLPGAISTSNNIQDNNWAFGLQEAHVQTINLRWVVAHKVQLGESWIQDFLEAIPGLLTVSGYQIVAIDRNASSVDTDHEAIYRAELGDTVYEKHRFTWNVYAISLNVEYIPCE